MIRFQGARLARIARGMAWAMMAALVTTGPAAYAQDTPAVSTGSAENSADLMAQTHRFDIPAGSLDAALTAFSEQTGIQLVYEPAGAQGQTVQAIVGTLTATSALQLLIDDANLTWVSVNDTTIAIRRADGASTNPTAGGEGIDLARRGGVEEIIVTGQKKAERLQDVPIAISAFSMEQLDAQKIEGGFDLLKGVPNVTFSKTNFTGYNFQIRGIGTQAVSATTDPGVAVSFNNTTLIVNRLFEQEYLDIERVEVLRGPQGTLYGRNATAGVINVISAKPEMGLWAAEVKAEVGSYNARRYRGHANIPLDENVALRLAGATTKRDGFGFNEFDGSDVDNRDLWTGRVTLGWQPTDTFRANLLWERFEEDDQRVRTSKQLCHHDPGPDMVGDASTANVIPVFRAFLSQGCLPGSLYDTGAPGLNPTDTVGAAHGAYGTPNGMSLPFVSGLFIGPVFSLSGTGAGTLGLNPYFPNSFFNPTPDPNPPCAEAAIYGNVLPLDLCNPDPYRGRGQSRDIRTIYSALQPAYQAEADIFEFSFDHDWSDGLTFSSQTVYVEDMLYSTQDYNRFQAFAIFSDANEACGIAELFPGFFNNSCDPEVRGTYPGASVLADGIFCDPQLKCSDSLVAQDISQSTSSQFNQEFRLVSSLDGPVNFSLGANYTRFRTKNDYFVFANALTLLTHFFPFNYDGVTQRSRCLDQGLGCVFVDPKPLEAVAANPEGHNFFLSANPYRLTSSAVFGELYWNATETLKLTAGVRVTWDRKEFTPLPSQLLLNDYRELDFISPGDGPDACLGRAVTERVACSIAGNAPGGRGFLASPDIVQEWREPTGRIVLDWKPRLNLPWWDETLVYLSLSRGYKGGGANPPSIAPPAGLINAENSGGIAAAAPPVFQPEYVNAVEVGSKNMLFGGGLIVNGNVFYYDYRDYQVSKIVDRSAANENFDATVWGAELELMLSPTPDLQLNAAIGHLRTRIANGETSLDLMDRTDGGNRPYAVQGAPLTIETLDDEGNPVVQTWDVIDEWLVAKPFVVSSSNCVIPSVVVEAMLEAFDDPAATLPLGALCPGGGPTGFGLGPDGEVQINDTHITYDYRSMSPNAGQGFRKDLSGRQLPNAPRWTVATGAQYRVDLSPRWEATGRVDFYWQDKSFARVYNTEYDRLRDWTNTNFSLWLSRPDWGLTFEAYVKNAFDEAPITGSFLNSDDSGLTTNVFTLDPRLVGLSVTKQF